MRCRACDVLISDKEATKKSSVTGEYFDLCTWCFNTIKDQVMAEDSPLFADSDEGFRSVLEKEEKDESSFD